MVSLQGIATIAASVSALIGSTFAAGSTNSSLTLSSTSSQSSVDVGARILQGLGASSSTSSNAADTASSTMTTSASSSTLATTTVARNASMTHSVSVPNAPIVWSSNFAPQYTSHAKSCWSAYTSWYASYPGYYETANVSSITSTHDETSYSTIPDSKTDWPTASVSTYTLCDGTPRATISPATTSFVINATQVYSNVEYTVSPATPSAPCQPNQDDCAIYYFGSNIGDIKDDNDFALSRRFGACGNQHDAEQPCLVQGGPVKLLYFPVSTEDNDTCHKSGSGSTITSAQKNEPITSAGTTYQPGSVYISFETLYAAYRKYDNALGGGQAVQIGPTFSNTVIAFKSDEISTNCYTSTFSDSSKSSGAYGPGTQLNYADLNSPVPASAYQCQNQCNPTSTFYSNGEYHSTKIVPNPCETIFDNFNPLLAVPTRLREMVPEWSTCQFWNNQQPNVIFDPPTALQAANAPAQPTLPGQHSSPAASPSPTAAPPASVTLPPAASSSTAASSQAPSPGAPSSSAPALSDNLPSDGGQGQPTSTPAAPANPPSQQAPSQSQPAAPADPGSSGNAPPQASQQPQPQPQPQPSEGGNGFPANPSPVQQQPTQATTPEVLDPAAPANPQGSATANPVNASPIAFTPIANSPAAANSPQPASQNNDTASPQLASPDSSAKPPAAAVPATGSTILFAPNPSAAPAEAPKPAALIPLASGQTLTAAAISNGAGGFIIAGTSTVAAGQLATLSNGAVLSAATNGVVVMQPSAGNSAQPGTGSSGDQVLAAGSVTITASSLPGTNAIAVGGTTLSQGGSAATVNGQVVSAASTGLVLVGAANGATSMSATGKAGSNSTMTPASTKKPSASLSSSRAGTSSSSAAPATATGAAEKIGIPSFAIVAGMAVLIWGL